jgi:DNA (cytosine-5)-methyltransferase 1
MIVLNKKRCNKQEKRKITDFLEQKVDDKYYYTAKSKLFPLLESTNMKENTVYQYRRTYVRENKSNECPCLTTAQGGHNVPIIKDNKGIRKLTPRECFNLQGFPIEYKFPDKMSNSNLYKLAGNAITVPIIKLIANKLIPILT